MQKPPFFIPVARHFSANGRISRLQYFVYGLIWLVIFSLAIGGLGFAQYASTGQDVTGLSGILMLGAVQLVLMYFVFCMAGKRAHDLGWSALICLLFLIDIPIDIAAQVARQYVTLAPILETIVKGIDVLANIASMGLGLALTFAPGIRGQNKYGPDPLRPPPAPIDVF